MVGVQLPINPYPGANYTALVGPYSVPQAGMVQGNPYAAAYAGRGGAQAQANVQNRGQQGSMYGNNRNAAPTRQQQPQYPDVGLVKLPFYDTCSELLKPASLITQGGNRFHEANFQFTLKPDQATDIASNRDIQVGTRMDYLYQIQLRFCPLEPGKKDIADEFPPSVQVHVNGKMVQLPNPIPTNKPGVEPKRPPKPVNITPHCKLSPILPNSVGIKWAAEYGKGWVVSINLVLKLTADDLLERLKKKGTREPEYTRNLIKKKLSSDNDEIATTSLKVSVICPLGKMRMKTPCRPSTCSHLQCFDASTFLQMNERKPKWDCPVCNTKALYDDLLIDGYYHDILDSKLTRDEENVILEKDGTWKVVPKEDEEENNNKKSGTKSGNSSPVKGADAAKDSAGGSTANKDANKEAADIDCISLSDDEDSAAPSTPSPPTQQPPPQPPLPPPAALPSQPTPPPSSDEIEIIDLD